MESSIIEFVILPQAPEDSQETIGQPAVGGIVGATVRADLVEISLSNGVVLEGSDGPLLDDMAKGMVAGAAEMD